MFDIGSSLFFNLMDKFLFLFLNLNLMFDIGSPLFFNLMDKLGQTICQQQSTLFTLIIIILI